MSRSRASAKAAGTRFESLVAGYLASRINPYIERRAKTGAKDKGDIAGIPGVVIECKDTTRTQLGTWMNEAEVERDNAGADYGVVAHKRHGVGDPEKQWVTMTLRDFAQLLIEAGK